MNRTPATLFVRNSGSMRVLCNCGSTMEALTRRGDPFGNVLRNPFPSRRKKLFPRMKRRRVECGLDRNEWFPAIELLCIKRASVECAGASRSPRLDSSLISSAVPRSGRRIISTRRCRSVDRISDFRFTPAHQFSAETDQTHDSLVVEPPT